MKMSSFASLLSLSLCLAGVNSLAGEGTTAPGNLTNVITQGKISATVKTLYFQRDFDDETPDWSTWAIGGNLGYETAPLFGFTVGLDVKTSQGDLLNSGDEVYTGLLIKGEGGPTDDESYTELDEYFLRYSNWDSQITLGAQATESPWVEGYDIRMTPKKYRGLTFGNTSFPNMEIQAFYLEDWLEWNAEDWQSVTAAITGNDNDDEGLLAGGLSWKSDTGLKLKFWDYYYNETMNAFYVRGDYEREVAEEFRVGANLRYLDQSDTGDALAGDIDTYQAGGELSLAAFGAKLSLYYGANGDDAIIAPFGGDKLVIMQVNNLSRAEEEIMAVKLSYSFERIGLPGLSAYVYYGSFDTPDNGTNASPDIDELNFDIQYKLGGWFKDCSLRLRHAIVDQDESVDGGKDVTDTRLYFVYRY